MQAPPTLSTLTYVFARASASGDEGRTDDDVLAGGWILPRGLEPGANFGI